MISNHFLCKDLESSNWNNRLLMVGLGVPGYYHPLWGSSFEYQVIFQQWPFVSSQILGSSRLQPLSQGHVNSLTHSPSQKRCTNVYSTRSLLPGFVSLLYRYSFFPIFSIVRSIDLNLGPMILVDVEKGMFHPGNKSPQWFLVPLKP